MSQDQYDRFLSHNDTSIKSEHNNPHDIECSVRIRSQLNRTRSQINPASYAALSNSSLNKSPSNPRIMFVLDPTQPCLSIHLVPSNRSPPIPILGQNGKGALSPRMRNRKQLLPLLPILHITANETRIPTVVAKKFTRGSVSETQPGIVLLT